MARPSVLIVDAEIISARELAARLGSMGYDVAGLASSGFAALQLAAETQPSVVLLDVVLQGDLDGVEAAADIRRRLQVPVVCITTAADNKALEGAEITAPFVVKPFSDRELHASIDMALFQHRVETRLRRLERWFGGAVDEIANAVIATDQEGVITVFNPAAQAITQWTRAQAIGRKLQDVFRLIDRASGQPVALEGVEAGPVVCLEGDTRLLDKSGRRVPVASTTSCLRDQQDRPTGTVSVFRDVTGQQHGAPLLVALNGDVALAATQAPTLHGMLQLCAEALVRHLNAAFARLWTLDTTGTTLLLQASAGMYTHLDGPHSRVPVGELKIGLIAQERQPHLTNDVLHDARISDPAWARRQGMVAFAGYPLMVDDRLVGVVAIFSQRTLSENALDALGSIAKTIAVAIERKRAEDSLRATQERLQSVLSLSPAVIYALKLDGENVVGGWVSENVRSMLGYDPAETQNTQWWYDNLHPEDWPTAPTLIPNLIEQGRHTSEYRFRDRQGAYHWLRDEKRLIRDAAGRPVECIGSWTDITERKRSEEALRKSEEELRTLFAAMTDIVLVLDAEGRYVKIAPTNPSNLYRPSKDLLGKRIHEVLPQEDADKMLHQVERALASHQTLTFEYKLNIGSREAWFDSSISPLTEDTVFWIAHDITEQKKLEEQFRQAQRMEAVGQLAGGVAHDFNNLLTVISGYSEMLLTDSGLDAATQEMVREISKAGERAASLTRQLLAFSRKQVLAPRILDLNALVTDQEKMLRRLIGEDVALRTALDPSLKRVKADPGLLEQVIINLAVNARDAMAPGGKLTLETSNVELDETYAHTHLEVKSGAYVMLTVSDTGCGMTPEVMASIFEPFFTTKGPGKGTGLGLATVYGIVKQSGGHVAVYSEPGLGTIFKVYLPRAEAELLAGTSRVGVHPMPQGSETILVVEDAEPVRAIARHTLEPCGYSVIEASNGNEALRRCEQHQGPIHLVVTDVVMPGMAGRLLTEYLATLRPEIKVLYMSGYTDDAVIRHGVMQAEAAFLQKPFTPQALATKVREVLDQPEESRRPKR